jgi:hypothetical protein
MLGYGVELTHAEVERLGVWWFCAEGTDKAFTLVFGSQCTLI